LRIGVGLEIVAKPRAPTSAEFSLTQINSRTDEEPTPIPLLEVMNRFAQPRNASPTKTVSAGIRLRQIQASDQEGLRALLRQHHANTLFRDQPFSNSKFDGHFELMLSRPNNMIAIIAELKDHVVGFAWSIAAPYILSDGPPLASVQVIAVELEKIGPVRRAKTFIALAVGTCKWANSIDASHSFVHVTTGSNLAATDRLMKATGAKFVGGSYVTNRSI
jgi:hypothetical protein